MSAYYVFRRAAAGLFYAEGIDEPAKGDQVMNLSKARKLFITLLCLQLSFHVGATDYIISGSSDCGLADAIRAANLDETVGHCPAGAGEDTILLAENITLSAALPTVRSDITITTNDDRVRRVISGNRAHSMFHIEDWGRLTLRQLDLIHAHSLGLHGGAVQLMQGHAHLTDVRLENNWAQLGGGALAVTIDGAATCDRCQFVSNMSGLGGAIWMGYETASLSLVNSRVHSNAADRGGGIFILGGSVNISDSTFTQNVAAIGQGADILVINGDLTIGGGNSIDPAGIDYVNE